MGCDEGWEPEGCREGKAAMARLKMRCCSVFWYSHSHFRPLGVQAKVKAWVGVWSWRIKLKSKTAHQQFNKVYKNRAVINHFLSVTKCCACIYRKRRKTMKILEYSVCVQPWNCWIKFMHKELQTIMPFLHCNKSFTPCFNPSDEEVPQMRRYFHLLCAWYSFESCLNESKYFYYGYHCLH